VITDCPACDAYFARRLRVIVRAIGRHVVRTGESPYDACSRFVRGVHARHLAGLSLETDVTPPASTKDAL